MIIITTIIIIIVIIIIIIIIMMSLPSQGSPRGLVEPDRRLRVPPPVALGPLVKEPRRKTKVVLVRVVSCKTKVVLVRVVFIYGSIFVYGN